MRTARVGELAEQVRGVTFAKSDASSMPADDRIAVLTAGNIQGGRLVLDELTYVPAKAIREPQRVRRNDVVVCASSGSLSVVGKAARAMGEFDGAFGAFLKVLRPGPDVDPGYFAHYFQTQTYRRRVSSLAAGANINNLKNEHLDNLEILLPPIDEQRRIAAILDHADALRAKRRHVLAHVDALAQSVFYEMFNRRQDPIAPLDSLADPQDRINYGVVQPGKDTTDGVPLIRVSNLVDGAVDRSSIKRIAPEVEVAYTRSRIRGTEILVSCVGSIGEVSVVGPQDVGSNVARAIARVPIADDSTRIWIASYLRTSGPQEYFRSELRTVAQPTLNVKQLATTPVPLPPAALRREFAQHLRQIQTQRTSVGKALAADDELFASLQSRAFRGEL